MSHLDHYAIIRTSYTDPTVRTILVWEGGQLRIVTNDERDLKLYRTTCSAKSPSWTQRVLPALFPLQAHLGTYRMRTRFQAAPLSPNGQLELSAALDELGQPKYDEVLYDERPQKGKS